MLYEAPPATAEMHGLRFLCPDMARPSAAAEQVCLHGGRMGSVACVVTEGVLLDANDEFVRKTLMQHRCPLKSSSFLSSSCARLLNDSFVNSSIHSA